MWPKNASCQPKKSSSTKCMASWGRRLLRSIGAVVELPLGCTQVSVSAAAPGAFFVKRTSMALARRGGFSRRGELELVALAQKKRENLHGDFGETRAVFRGVTEAHAVRLDLHSVDFGCLHAAS